MHAPFRFFLAIAAAVWLGTATQPERDPAHAIPVDAPAWTELLALQIERLDDAIAPIGDGEALELLHQIRDAHAAVQRLQTSLGDNVSDERLACEFAEVDQRVDGLIAALPRFDPDRRVASRDVIRISDSRDQLRRRFSADESPVQDRLLQRVRELLADEAGDLRRTAQGAPGDDPRMTTLDWCLVRFVEAVELQDARETDSALTDADDALEIAWQDVARCLKRLEPSESVMVLRRAARLERLVDRLHHLGAMKGERADLIVRS